MLHNQKEFPQYIKTAGRITIATALAGLVVIVLAFMFDVGSREFARVSAADTASTTLIVLNTPPAFMVNAHEVIGSSTTAPTNSGSVIQWAAKAADSNGAPYFLLICSTNATPTANPALNLSSLGTEPPNCSTTASVQWGVSAATPSGSQAVVSTTTAEGGLFSTSSPNIWYAWVCDDDPFNPECNVTPVQGYSATNSSPFVINSRPKFIDFYNGGAFDPADTATFFSTSTDLDAVTPDQDIYLVVCSSNTDYNVNTNTCPNDLLASTTISSKTNATASFVLPTPLRDDDYPAYGYLVDQYGHEAINNAQQADYTINNVAPVVASGDIQLNGGLDMAITTPGAETTGFTLDFTITDANSCLNAASTSEIAGYDISIFRNGIGLANCDPTVPDYDANNCYTNGVPAATWNLVCSATTTCASPLQDSMDYHCTFPLWHITDPTRDGAVNLPPALEADYWTAGVAGTDEALTGSMSTTSQPVDVTLLNALDLLTAEIPYGSLKPGQNTGFLDATTTILSIGNTALDQEVRGESMCDYFAVGNECLPSSTSTVPDRKQQYASTSRAYDPTESDPLNILLSSTTPTEVELNVQKATATSTLLASQGITYWGIGVPGTITKAGNYSGLNTFSAVTAEPADWY